MNFDFKTFETNLYEECSQAFPQILADLKEEKIYCIALYYSCAGWGYLFPSVFTEAGLAEISPTPPPHDNEKSQEKTDIALKWSPCDSPHHTTYENSLPKTAKALTKFDDYLTQQHNRDEAESNPPHKFTNYYEVAIENIRHATLTVLKKLKDDGLLGDDKETILITLLSGDQSIEEILESTQFVNSATLHQSLKDDMLALYGKDYF